MAATLLDETGGCRRVAGALARVGDKWAVLVLMELDGETRRFNELRRELSDISPKMLASTLRALERDGFVTRTVHPTNPPSVEYALTELGDELVVPIRALGEWVLGNVARIERARANYDALSTSATAPALAESARVAAEPQLSSPGRHSRTVLGPTTGRE